MLLSRNWRLFGIGFAAGTLLLILFPIVASLTNFETIEPIFTLILPQWWLFEANPVLLVLCRLFDSGLCYGLGLDGGPLEWAELAWFFISPGILYGLVFLLIDNAIRGVKRLKQR